MAVISGNEIIARCLKERGIEDIFYLMGAPMLDCLLSCESEGIRLVDVRHEQAAAMMATGYSRLRRTPSVCMAASGPGVMNLVTGIANAHWDGSPVVVLGGASPISQRGTSSFQEMDQVGVFRPITRWAEECLDVRLLPEYIHNAFLNAYGSAPGPVYLDLPGDVLYGKVDEEDVQWVPLPAGRPMPYGDPALIEDAVKLLEAAERPVLMTGSGILWSEAEDELRAFVDQTGIPFFATPQGRGVVPEDHELAFLAARSKAFRETDLIVLVGTRQSFVSEYTRAPRWNPDAKFIQVDLVAEGIGRTRRPDVGIVGDAKAVLKQLVEAGAERADRSRYSAWTDDLRETNAVKARPLQERMESDARPIHPLRLCKEVSDVMPDDTIVVADGQEILTFARQSIPFLRPQSLNSGPFGCMGVGLPLGLGAKIAKPDQPVVILHGDGSFGLNAMEMDTAIRHNIPVVCVISNNGGWTARQEHIKVGRELGFTRYDQMFAPLGCHTEFVEDPADLRPALERAFASGKPALVNVITDPEARANTTAFAMYET